MGKQDKSDIAFISLVRNSEAIQRARADLILSVKQSLTGITNLVVNHEDPCIIDYFIDYCFGVKELYRGTKDIDAVELQKGRPGSGFACAYIDSLIFGNFDLEEKKDPLSAPSPKIDPNTGKRIRKMDGFVSRKQVMLGDFNDKLLIIKNIDYCMDFCQNAPGVVDARASWIFDNFRNPMVKRGCRLLLITNKPLKLPFQIRTIEFPMVNKYEVEHIINSFVDKYSKSGYKISLNDSHRFQIIRKLSGMTYTQASDVMASSIASGYDNDKVVKPDVVVKNLREYVNRMLMDGQAGLTHLSPRPWEDYICPESSNFTFDVAKILRDFEEIRQLKYDREKILSSGGEDKILSRTIQAIQTRMPHVILLYGRGGVGKSAFPVHFAGLMDLDIWDFNIGASHSKWIGEGAERMRSALKRISESSHVVIRIDEYDKAIGATDSDGSGMHSAHKQVEAELMNWLQNSQEDNLFIKNNIFLVLTTNHKENITGPLLRSGRADLVIDISDFDSKSMTEAFMSAPRRMYRRGVEPIGVYSQDHFLKMIESLDINVLSDIAVTQGFTVRDIDMLLLEMASHDYYFKKGKSKIRWRMEDFVSVLENSTGSVKNESTNELVLGDRIAYGFNSEKDLQVYFPFFDKTMREFCFQDLSQN